jgi:hypothetical protein
MHVVYTNAASSAVWFADFNFAPSAIHLTSATALWRIKGKSYEHYSQCRTSTSTHGHPGSSPISLWVALPPFLIVAIMLAIVTHTPKHFSKNAAGIV